MKIASTISTYKLQDVSCGTTQLVVMLFDSAIRYTKDAAGHLRAGRWNEKGQAVDAALSCIGELRKGLNHEAGGAVVAHLDRMYDFLCTKLTMGNVAKDPVQFDQVVASLEDLRAAWNDLFNRLKASGALVEA
ncbi:flagellar export chaperone FliS [candidate division KSB1 bacterium]|nr:flagellar export chaperone FliS [candidate division KSB1 bacterium]